MSKFGRRDSLVRQASLDRLQNAAIKQQNVEKHRKEIAESPEYARILKELNDEGIELIWSFDADVPIRIAVVLAAEEDSAQFLSTILMEYEMNGVRLKHLEIRPEQERNGSYMMMDSKKNLKVKFEIFTDCECTKDAFLKAAKCLAGRYHIRRLNIYNSTDGSLEKIPWFPKHISDLDKCYHCVIKYEPTSDPRHPGYGDKAYIQRREQLNAIAKAYKYGEKLPDIEYTPEEHKTWEVVFNKLKSLHPSHTCVEYQQNFRQMELEGLLESTRIPKLSLIDRYLQSRTGFKLRPCAGLLSARDFLAGLAFRTFQTTIYIRHHGSPHHSPEPDLIHEFIGHCPMFADPLIAQFSQQIGLLSLGATDEQIEQLATVYWFTVEFGLCRQNGQLKAIGAGLLSSYGELMHACSDKPQHEVFNPQRAALQKYEDFDYQPLYFVADSIFDAVTKLRVFAQNFQRPFMVTYDPYTDSVEVIRGIEDLKDGLNRFKGELSSFTEAVEVLSKNTAKK
ncbi:tryptophan hydroxylase 1 [Loa loa]|uniref:Tryptophan hydroxylase 1 n=1 Tax=Loa loa TaxID=7209 RepID=A0A1I7VLI9_LOALO|nr:tryptophan hydroxylase 1 [Loa loa]EFO26336.1 tryptophan hydroxylase 1 [Loa loa]